MGKNVWSVIYVLFPLDRIAIKFLALSPSSIFWTVTFIWTIANQNGNQQMQVFNIHKYLKLIIFLLSLPVFVALAFHFREIWGQIVSWDWVEMMYACDTLLCKNGVLWPFHTPFSIPCHQYMLIMTAQRLMILKVLVFVFLKHFVVCL